MQKLPKSLKKYIRREKARIRREIVDLEKQREKIEELYKKLIKKKDDNQGNS